MHLLGLIGYPLSHSFSERYFAEKFNRMGIASICYMLFPLPELSALPDLLSQYPNLRGFNVTIPHKKAILPYLDDLDPTAKAIGAVNTVVVKAGRLLHGYNTDAEGFQQALLAWIHAQGASLSLWQKEKALILGTGGSAQAVSYALKQLGIAHQFVSRRPKTAEQLSYADVDDPQLWDRVRLLVNTTPLGMYPAVNTCPNLPFEYINERHWVFDLVYNPSETLLLQRAKRQGAHTTNGLDMLYRQAEAAWAIWQKEVLS
ncbi:MAG: shikimate dehydrogenase [Saprospiraceae bacterium]|nr:shikimate dehydrogenase [Saprospiraceae bacterium]MDW8484719.1 shikimate dehydrogenase [Saprospiraceae bacterium]